MDEQKLKLDASELKQLTKAATQLIGKKQTNPILETVLIMSEDRKLVWITFTDLKVWVSYQMQAGMDDGDGRFDSCVDAKMLGKVLRNIKKEVDIELTQLGIEVMARYNGMESKLMRMLSKDFPLAPDIKDEEFECLTINASSLYEAVMMALPVICIDETSERRLGALWFDGEYAFIVDRHRGHRLGFICPMKKPFYLAQSVVKLLSTLLLDISENAEVNIYSMEDRVEIEIKDKMVITSMQKRIEDVPPYKKVWPSQSSSIDVSVNAFEFRTLLNEMKAFANKVRFTFQRDESFVMSVVDSEDAIRATSKVDARVDFRVNFKKEEFPINVHYDVHYLLDVVAASYKEKRQISLHVFEKYDPLLIITPSSEAVIMLIAG